MIDDVKLMYGKFQFRINFEIDVKSLRICLQNLRKINETYELHFPWHIQHKCISEKKIDDEVINFLVLYILKCLT